MSGEGGTDFMIFRVFEAPRERVWQALTETERLKDWWPPKTFTMIHASMDLRPGGVFHCGMRSVEGYKMWAKFIYSDVVPHRTPGVFELVLRPGGRSKAASHRPDLAVADADHHRA